MGSLVRSAMLELPKLRQTYSLMRPTKRISDPFIERVVKRVGIIESHKLTMDDLTAMLEARNKVDGSSGTLGA